MKRILLIFTFLMTLTISEAQTSNYVNSAIGTTAGTLLNQLTSNLKVSSFLPTWTNGKVNWLAAATKIKDAKSFSSSLSTLAGFIKPEMFKSGFIVENFKTLSTKIKTMSAAANLLKNLENNIKPEAFGTNWTKIRTTWLKGVSAIK